MQVKVNLVGNEFVFEADDMTEAAAIVSHFNQMNYYVNRVKEVSNVRLNVRTQDKNTYVELVGYIGNQYVRHYVSQYQDPPKELKQVGIYIDKRRGWEKYVPPEVEGKEGKNYVFFQKPDGEYVWRRFMGFGKDGYRFPQKPKQGE